MHAQSISRTPWLKCSVRTLTFQHVFKANSLWWQSKEYRLHYCIFYRAHAEHRGMLIDLSKPYNEVTSTHVETVVSIVESTKDKVGA